MKLKFKPHNRRRISFICFRKLMKSSKGRILLASRRAKGLHNLTVSDERKLK
jgi:large subunit ribosomal protein L34